MAITQVPLSLRTTVWAKRDFSQILYKSALGSMLNSGVAFRPKEFDGKGIIGQNLEVAFTGKLTQPGLGRGQTLWGNEEALNIGDINMRIGLIRVGVANPNDEDTVEAAETNYEFENSAREVIANSMAEKFDYSVFNQLAGNNSTSLALQGITYTSGNIANVQGQNPILAPSADRIIRAGGVANDQSLTSANRMNLSLVDYAIEMLMNSNQQVTGLNNGFLGQLWMSWEQYTDLKQDTDSPITWYNNVLAMAAGGDSDPLTGKGLWKNILKPVGEYAGIQLFAHPRVSYGVNSGTLASITNVRRAVLVTNNAFMFSARTGKGRSTDPNVPFVYKVQLADYEYIKGIEGRAIIGIKKMQPSNGSDIGSLVISTYAAAHTG